MRNIHKIIIFIIISFIIIVMAGCVKETDTIATNVATADTAPTDTTPAETANMDAASTDPIIRENKTITSLSPDGKYRAEAYGTITTITAGGLFPYEGVRILSVDNGDIIWSMEHWAYTVSFTWSPNSQYLGIYYTGRIWGESIIVDIENKEQISLPKLVEIASHYGENVKPQEDRPDQYFEICGWEDSETVIVDFCWTKADGEEFNGQYTFNVKTYEVVYK
ncbi:MAG: hypothetical protein GX200_06685 [Firmicutes bacterium]|nr:hypothetical protein [Bacillota bacterium]